MTENIALTFINPQSGIIKLQKLRSDATENVFFDKDVPWLCNLLEELNEHVEEEDRKLTDCTTFIEFKGQITKKKNTKFEEMLIFKGKISAKYLTYCVSTGEVMSDTLEVDIAIGAIDKDNQKKYGYDDDIIDIEINGEELDLYYFEDHQLNLASIIHEYIYLNKNPYPRLTKQ